MHNDPFQMTAGTQFTFSKLDPSVLGGSQINFGINDQMIAIKDNND